MRKIGTDPLLISMQWAKLQSVVDEASARGQHESRPTDQPRSMITNPDQSQAPLAS